VVEGPSRPKVHKTPFQPIARCGSICLSSQLHGRLKLSDELNGPIDLKSSQDPDATEKT
jgi:hypothetical protein